MQGIEAANVRVQRRAAGGAAAGAKRRWERVELVHEPSGQTVQVDVNEKGFLALVRGESVSIA